MDLFKRADQIYTYFTLFDIDGNPISGETGNFTFEFTKNASVGTPNGVFASGEIGSTGTYYMYFSDTTAGTNFWHARWYHPTYNLFGWEGDWLITPDGVLTAADIYTQAGAAVDASATHGYAQTANAMAADYANDRLLFALQATLLTRSQPGDDAYIAIGSIEDGAITAATLADDVDTYQAKVWLFDDEANSTDRYTVVWFKNSQPVLSGVTAADLQVIKSDGTDLIATTSITEIGSTGLFKHEEMSNRIISGSAYYAKITATIDGLTRTWVQQIGRDSV